MLVPVGELTHAVGCGRPLHYRAMRVAAPDGIVVSVQDWAPDSAPRKADILLLHGFSQSHEVWLNQVTSSLAAEFRLVTYDLRGHGSSDKPPEAHYYQESSRWAGEVKSVIDAAGLDRPIVIAWSYAGRVILDYLSLFGDGRLGGLIMANATSKADAQVLGPAVGLMRQMTDADPAVALQGTIAFLNACVAVPLPPDEFEFMLNYNLRVPAHIRANLGGRPAQYEPVLQSLRLPTLVVHGSLDPINLPAMAAYTLKQVRDSTGIIYDQVAHMPFWNRRSNSIKTLPIS